uniref:U3 small nucleolar RNA-associated protein 11 n=1 Tax=Pyramimonas obovata TaxID=1411642 RepID=A0A7S0MV76_9CHLO|mmetsp:Transcript_14266/g.30559  ORF Transcript_14266/g.30559 Transcript_14266/m.30559 type:complete len:224 (+) Transcript_14266:297-968(+)|eukprot:CAMPEP_0118930090 /NCGR_PEP_ID=MMETSP1169-20130426/6892_1 /TAXON_ID=36882 /ORGANISM="Pyramimonas obovata, Strain CCMP722" /LENGTH=223 /DNA_ID=CAMNT_0006872391 /DNA_START=277 /DNA_END=948 /DNA_ORIENTATION=-
MSSALRNAVKRKTHKERSQPSARKRFGLLEKHKDYVLRARDYHKKEKTIKTLREKAEFRNPDEFYFAMQKASTKDGVHNANQHDPERYTAEQLKLLKSQDAKYVHLKAQVDAKKLEKMKSSLHRVGEEPQNKHTVFVGDRPKEKKRRNAEIAEFPKHIESERKKAYHQVQVREQRLKGLMKVAEGMALEQALRGKGHKRKLEVKDAETGQKTTVFRWKKERKK